MKVYKQTRFAMLDFITSLTFEKTLHLFVCMAGTIMQGNRPGEHLTHAYLHSWIFTDVVPGEEL